MSKDSAAPPTPQEIHRKLSVHSASAPVPITPGRGRAGSFKKSSGAFSGNESDSDGPSTSYFSPLPASGTSELSSSLPPLTVINERRNVSGEESDDDEEEEGEWRAGPDADDVEKENEETIVKSGYLWKKGERRKTWKKRWFVLRTGKMAYYKTDQEYKLHRLLDLRDIHAVTPVSLKKHTNTFGIVTPTRTFYIQANSPSDCDSWVRALNEVRTRLKEESLETPVPGTPRELTHSRQLSNPLPVTPAKKSISTLPPPIEAQAAASSSQSFAAPPPSPLGMLTSSDSDDPFTTASPPPRTRDVQDNVINDPKKVILNGYLMKCGSKRKNWRKRWFVLTSEKLVYAKSHMNTKRLKHIPLDKIIDAIEYELPAKHQYAVSGGSITGGGGAGQARSAPSDHHAHPESGFGDLKHTFKIITTKRPFLVCAPSEEEEIKWLSAVRALIARRMSSVSQAQQTHASEYRKPGAVSAAIPISSASAAQRRESTQQFPVASRAPAVTLSPSSPTTGTTTAAVALEKLSSSET